MKIIHKPVDSELADRTMVVRWGWGNIVCILDKQSEWDRMFLIKCRLFLRVVDKVSPVSHTRLRHFWQMSGPH